MLYDTMNNSGNKAKVTNGSAPYPACWKLRSLFGEEPDKAKVDPVKPGSWSS